MKKKNLLITGGVHKNWKRNSYFIFLRKDGILQFIILDSKSVEANVLKKTM